jgi:hypothetical protein
MSSKTHILVAAALLTALSPASALAQDTTTDTTTMDAPREERDRDFPWGLLGLLGLAGLLGKKRDNNDIHVDRTNRT